MPRRKILLDVPVSLVGKSKNKEILKWLGIKIITVLNINLKLHSHGNNRTDQFLSHSYSESYNA